MAGDVKQHQSVERFDALTGMTGEIRPLCGTETARTFRRPGCSSCGAHHTGLAPCIEVRSFLSNGPIN